MIISFDGNVFAGKTTLINKLAKEFSCNKIPEHSFFIDKVRSENMYSNGFMDAQVAYMLVDKLRMSLTKKGINILDRSFFSMSAHVYALFRNDIADIRRPYLELLKDLMLQKKIIIPDKYVIVTCPHAVALERFEKDNIKGTENLYIDKSYYEAVDDFNKKWSDVFQAFFIDTGSKVCLNTIIFENIIKNESSRCCDDREIVSVLSDILEI